MRILIVVHDLIPEKWHLMPWRTVVEVVNGLRAEGHDALLVSLENTDIEVQTFDSQVLPEGTLRISKLKHQLSHQLNNVTEMHQTDVIFWPVTWREPRWRTKVITDNCSQIIGWFPGGVYSKLDSIYALRKMGVKKSLPYVLESFYPKAIQLRYFRSCGVQALLAMTAATAKMATYNGWEDSKVYVVPPGKDVVKKQASVISDETMDWLDGEPFMLFMGPPSAIRGVYELLDAFELAAEKSNTIRLICLFRSDAKLESDAIRQKIEGMRAKSRIFTKWESLAKDELNGFIQACHVAVMPFILVPSEIPLAIIEATAYGKPVLSTMCGGTGEYVSEFGASSPIGDISALADSMLKIFNDKSYYAECRQAAVDKYAGHPLWSEVASGWGNVAKQVLADSE